MRQQRIFKTPCPTCGGKVEYWSFSDCNYSEGSGIACTGCDRVFTSDEWDKIATKELKPEMDKRKRAEKRLERKKKQDELIRKRSLQKLTKKERDLLDLR